MASTALAPSGSRLATVREYRSLFPLLYRYVYLNSNATGATPWPAKLVLDEYWRTHEQWWDEVWRRWLDDLDRHADEIAALIGAPPGSVVCDTNVATLLSRVMSCFDFRERTGVVTTDLEFPSAPFVLRAFRRYGAVLTVVPSCDGIEIDAASAKNSVPRIVLPSNCSGRTSSSASMRA